MNTTELPKLYPEQVFYLHAITIAARHYDSKAFYIPTGSGSGCIVAHFLKHNPTWVVIPAPTMRAFYRKYLPDNRVLMPQQVTAKHKVIAHRCNLCRLAHVPRKLIWIYNA